MSVLWYGLESLGEIARAEIEGAAAAALGRAGAAWKRARPKVATAAATALAAVLTPPFVVGRLVLGMLDDYAPSRPVERWTVTVDGEEVPPSVPGGWKVVRVWRADDLAEQGTLEVASAELSRYVRCSCCDASFYSAKPQDPDRDTGFGTCDGCHDRIVESWMKHGGHGPWCRHAPTSCGGMGDCGRPTEEEARAYLSKYA